MRRTLALGVVAAVAASIMAAPAAQAQTLDCTTTRFPAQNVVVIAPGVINVYPANAPGYATTVADWAAGLALCIVNDVAGPPVSCVKTIVANRPTVTIDPNTLAITIDYSDLLSTACRLT